MDTKLLTRLDFENIMVALDETKKKLRDAIFKTNDLSLQRYYINILNTYDKLAEKIDIILGEE